MQNTYPKGIWDDLIVLMLMLQPFISNVSDNFQITIEIILIIMLSINLVHYKFNSSHIFIIYCLVFSCILSFISNNLIGFMLNTKIFLLCILVLFYFENKLHKHFFFVEIFIWINAAYAIMSSHFNIFYFEDMSSYTRIFIPARPTALLGSPHMLSFVIGIYVIYLWNIKTRIYKKIIFIYALLSCVTFTYVIAAISQYIYLIANKIIKINPIIFVFAMLLFIYSMKDIIIDIAFTIGIIRPHSLEALMDIVYDPVYWKEMFRIIPIDYASFLQYHNEVHSIQSNEIGIIKIFVEGGFFLAMALLLHIYKYSKYMLVYLIVSGLHYIFIINVPFTLFLVLQFNKKISNSSIYIVNPQR